MSLRSKVALHSLVLAAALALPQRVVAQADVDAVSSDTAPSVTVHVVNNNWSEIRVYAVSGASTWRLGTVQSFRSTRLKLPRWLTSPKLEFQLIAVPIGSTQRFVSQPILVSPGERITWQIENNLALSSVHVGGS